MAASLHQLTCLTSARFRARAPGPVSGRLYGTASGGAGHPVPLSRCLSAAGIRFSVIRFPPRSWASLTVGLPSITRTPTGLPRSTRTSYDRGGCLLYPEDGDAHPTDLHSPAGACRFPAASPYPHYNIPSTRALLTRHQRRFTRFTRPVFPLPVAPGWNGHPWASPPSFTPRQHNNQRRTSGWGRAIEHEPGTTLSTSAKPPIR